ncbi:hypothetical protein [Micromonospora arborensis]|uniref:hypothetical protein n=1 Tax=Micromonospora arborensis TaxID=2116518 RepID=UPI0037238FEA
MTLEPAVTFVAGDNGTDTSTIIKAIAVAAGFNPRGHWYAARFKPKACTSSTNPNPPFLANSQRYLHHLFQEDG